MKQRIELREQQLALAKESLDRERESAGRLQIQMDGFHPAMGGHGVHQRANSEDTMECGTRENAFVASPPPTVGEH
eukprot:12624525-Prorocentrum_lima.AAC.1